MKTNIQKIISIILIITGILLIVYSGYYFLNHKKDVDPFLTEIEYVKPSTSKIDGLFPQPTPNVKITTSTPLKTEEIYKELKLADFKKLFKTSAKSILVIEKETCGFCKEYEPKIKQALIDLNLNAFRIKVDILKTKELKELKKYVYYNATPTTMIIQNGQVIHTFEGSTDTETIKAFLDLYYIRDGE